MTFNGCRASQRRSYPYSLNQSCLVGPPLKTEMNNLSPRSIFPLLFGLPHFHLFTLTTLRPTPTCSFLVTHCLLRFYFLLTSFYLTLRMYLLNYSYFIFHFFVIYIPFIDSVSYSSFTLFLYLCVLSVVMITTQATQRNVPRL